MLPKLSTTIEDLPCELMVKIFKSLNYEFVDLINLFNLRLVCKKWSIIIKNEIKFNELNIIELNFMEPKFILIDTKCSWFNLNKKFDCRYNLYDNRPTNTYDIQEPILNRIYLKSKLFTSFFRNLKYLNLFFRLDDKFNVEFLNEFKFLIQLQIWKLILSKELIINLSNLNTLAIYYLITKDNLLIIDAPKLNNLFILDGLNKIKFKDTKSIKYLEVGQNWMNEASHFQNLEILYSHINNAINLEFLPNLKQLNIYDNDMRVMDDYRSKCIRLLNKKIELKRSNLEITLQSIKLTPEKQFNGINFFEKTPFLQLNYYELLSVKLPFLTRLELGLPYSSIQNIIDKLKNPQLNDLFISKFNNIKSIQIVFFKEKNQIDLLNLLSKFDNLCELELMLSSFENDFFNRLPDFCPNLNYLKIVSTKRKKNDYNLMLKKFNYLIYVDLVRNYTKPRTVADCFEFKKHILAFHFYYRKKVYVVQRINNYFFYNHKRIFLDFNQLKTKLLSINKIFRY